MFKKNNYFKNRPAPPYCGRKSVGDKLRAVALVLFFLLLITIIILAFTYEQWMPRDHFLTTVTNI
ncbi:MAG: hypothetical protein R3Y07_02805 [Eubacteriales bacterium]